ncbi:hypothetical protein F53441_8242 [Fusarium austroafricanum]|uniref:Uncharacterized protein n=1 Tax=Fusarium austroafricanum TaxID=2364996 RepID=A0A8H4KEV7_9HYPO|nr:hypothetical protein F53441_8242 [Fusarium austroafricanum]
MTAKPCHSIPESWWYSDSARYEYIKSDVFWTLAILILANAWWSAKQVDSFPHLPDEHDDKVAKLDLTKPRSGFWLTDRINSRLRQYLALLACTSVFPLLFLHGSWVLKSAWRITFGLVRRTYPSIRPRMLGFVLYSPFTAVILLSWAIVLGAGVFIIATQLLLWIKLWEMDPSKRVAKAPHKDIKDTKDIKDKTNGDGDWDEIRSDEQEENKKT